MKPSDTTTLKDKVPIWLVDWHFKDKHGSIRIQERIIMKFHKGEDVMNNPLLISIAMKKGRPRRKNHTFKPFKVVVKSQHSFGPPYERREFEQAQRLFDSQSRKIK